MVTCTQREWVSERASEQVSEKMKMNCFVLLLFFYRNVSIEPVCVCVYVCICLCVCWDHNILQHFQFSGRFGWCHVNGHACMYIRVCMPMKEWREKKYQQNKYTHTHTPIKLMTSVLFTRGVKCQWMNLFRALTIQVNTYTFGTGNQVS